MGLNLGIRGMIYSKFPNEAAFADAIHWSRQRLNKITHGQKMPSLGDISEMADGLNEPFMNVAKFFLVEESTTVDE